MNEIKICALDRLYAGSYVFIDEETVESYEDNGDDAWIYCIREAYVDDEGE